MKMVENASKEKNYLKDKLLILLFYGIAFVITYITVSFIPISDIFARTLVADLISTVFIYLISVIYRNTSVYDPYWSVYPSFIVFYWFSLWYSISPSISAKQILVIILVVVYCIRLTSNWIKYWKGFSHEDWRYSMYREKGRVQFEIINLTGLQMMPTLMVFAGSLSLYPALTPNSSINFLTIIGVLITINAILFELIGDIQMHRFAKTKKEGEYIDTGLWKYSRHPNYFGEVTLWWGFWFLGISSNFDYWWTIVGPIAITFLFLFVSIPMMEKRNLQRRPRYSEYQNRVSKLIPWRRKEN